MSDLKTEMPRREPGNEMSEIKAGGLKGNQSGGHWESETPSVENIEQHLVEIQYPIRRDDLVQHIRWQKAPLEAVYFVERLPDREFQNEGEIRQALEQLG